MQGRPAAGCQRARSADRPTARASTLAPAAPCRPTLPSGSVRSRAGTIMAGAVQFDCVIAGRGGHAAMPHLTHDPVVAAAAMVGALQARPGWLGSLP